jgi:acyl-CoA synthetase (AMP-forming)/AMP-acid ligase II
MGFIAGGLDGVTAAWFGGATVSSLQPDKITAVKIAAATRQSAVFSKNGNIPAFCRKPLRPL